jgi:hypothetical protein
MHSVHVAVENMFVSKFLETRFTLKLLALFMDCANVFIQVRQLGKRQPTPHACVQLPRCVYVFLHQVSPQVAFPREARVTQRTGKVWMSSGYVIFKRRGIVEGFSTVGARIGAKMT